MSFPRGIEAITNRKPANFQKVIMLHCVFLLQDKVNELIRLGRFHTNCTEILLSTSISGPEKWEKIHTSHEDDELVRKFHIYVFDSSPNVFHELDVAVEVKRHFVQLSLCKRQQINVLRLLPFQLIRECLPDIFGSEDLEQSTCKSD